MYMLCIYRYNTYVPPDKNYIYKLNICISIWEAGFKFHSRENIKNRH